VQTFARVFLICGIVAIPCIVMNADGNAGQVKQSFGALVDVLENTTAEAMDDGLDQRQIAMRTVGTIGAVFVNFVNASIGMYSTTDAGNGIFASDFYKNIARTTLGNIYATDQEITDGTVEALWTTSFTDSFVTLVLVVLASYGATFIKDVVREVDLRTVTMGDYSIRISPVGELHHKCQSPTSGKWEFGTR
jgi:hypothetical protein